MHRGDQYEMPSIPLESAEDPFNREPFPGFVQFHASQVEANSQSNFPLVK